MVVMETDRRAELATAFPRIDNQDFGYSLTQILHTKDAWESFGALMVQEEPALTRYLADFASRFCPHEHGQHQFFEGATRSYMILRGLAAMGYEFPQVSEETVELCKANETQRDQLLKYALIMSFPDAQHKNLDLMSPQENDMIDKYLSQATNGFLFEDTSSSLDEIYAVDAFRDWLDGHNTAFRGGVHEVFRLKKKEMEIAQGLQVKTVRMVN
jgi:hypothetical protein